MKKFSLIAGALLMLAAPLHAYVQTGNLVNGPRGPRSIVRDGDLGLHITPGTRTIAPPIPVGEGQDETTQPVPEPGTMAMASMGLLALGAAIRRKRAR
jgi:PEP-CTERM motif-containing protein